MNEDLIDLMYQFDSKSGLYIDTSKQIISLDMLPASIRRGFEAARAASFHSDGPLQRTKMGASIYAGSRIVAVGFNQYNKSKPGNRFFKLAQDGSVVEYTKSIHAEQSALTRIRYRDYGRTNKLILFVFRQDAKGLPAASSPCEMCQGEIQRAGIQTVHFIAPGGFYGRWEVS